MRALAKIAACLLLCLLCAGVNARITDTQKLVSRYAGKEPLRSGIIGMLAVRGASDTLLSYNPGKKLLPASNVKLITTGLALTSLGPGWRWRTTIACSGEIRDSVLLGDIYIVGGGDPTTGVGKGCAEPAEATFGAWRSILEANGIKSISGRIIGDPRCVPASTPDHNPSWQAEDLGFDYGAAPGGLNFYENIQEFAVWPSATGQPPVIRPIYPQVPWMSWTISATTGQAGTPNTLYCVNTSFGPWGEFFGSFPSDRSNGSFKGSNRFGAWTCAYEFYKYLTASGFEVSGGFGDISPSDFIRTDLLYSDIGSKAVPTDSLRTLGSTLSPPIAQIIIDTNTESDNFYAEAMLSALGNRREQILASMGLPTGNECSLIDGSGLSRKNYVSPSYLVRFLKAMLKSKARGPYLASLPSPGNGTLKNRMPLAPQATKKRILMKSGSMNGVLCFSGYILPVDPKGEMIVFSILTNNVSGPSYAVGMIIDEILLSLAAEQ